MNKKRIFMVGGMILSIILIVTVLFMQTRSNSLESHLKLAVKYYNEGNYEEAILEFDKAIEINDKIPNVYFAKANVQIALGKEEDALISSVNMIELLKNNYEYNGNEVAVLSDVLGSFKYLNYDELFLWFYETAYENSEYKDYCKWIEGYLGDLFTDKLEQVRSKYEKVDPGEYLVKYDSVLSSYKKALKNNFQYDFASGEDFENVYPNVNPELISGIGMSDLQYALSDINGDSVPELIIGTVKEHVYAGAADEWCPDYVVWDMYGLKNEQPKRIIDIYSVGYRRLYKICNDGIIGCMSVGSSSITGYYFYSVEDASSVSVLALQEDTSIYEGRYLMGVSTAEEEITKEKFDSLMNGYTYRNDFSWNIIDYSDFVESGNISQESSILTLEEAMRLASDTARNKGEWNSECKIALDNQDNDKYTFRLLEDSVEKQTTINWYYVDKNTREVTSMF